VTVSTYVVGAGPVVARSQLTLTTLAVVETWKPDGGSGGPEQDAGNVSVMALDGWLLPAALVARTDMV
jgi:hypothetical protein